MLYYNMLILYNKICKRIAPDSVYGMGAFEYS